MKLIEKPSYAPNTFGGKTVDGRIEKLTAPELLRLLTDITDKLNVLIAERNEKKKK